MTTEALWKRFVTNVPESKQEFRTIEVWHYQLKAVHRFVSARHDMELKLEPSAPRDGDTRQDFRAATLQIVEPSERQDSEQSLSVTFGNVDSTVSDMIDLINGQGYFTPVQVIYRKYYSDDLSAPCQPPLYLYAWSIAFNGPTSASFTAEDTDLSQKRSGQLYRLEQYPGLRE